MALSAALCIAVMIKSAYLSRSLVDRCPEKSADPSASSSVDSLKVVIVSTELAGVLKPLKYEGEVQTLTRGVSPIPFGFV